MPIPKAGGQDYRTGIMECTSRGKEKWGKLTDDDLTAVEGKKDKLLGLLQQKYGYAKDKAEQEYKDFIVRYKGK